MGYITAYVTFLANQLYLDPHAMLIIRSCEIGNLPKKQLKFSLHYRLSFMHQKTCYYSEQRNSQKENLLQLGIKLVISGRKHYPYVMLLVAKLINGHRLIKNGNTAVFSSTFTHSSTYISLLYYYIIITFEIV